MTDALVGSGLDLQQLYARQVDPRLQAHEIPADIDLMTSAAQLGQVLAGATTSAETRRVTPSLTCGRAGPKWRSSFRMADERDV